MLCRLVSLRLIQKRPGIFPSIEPGAAVRRRRPRFLLRRQPLHFHLRVDEGIERARQLRADPVEAILDEGHDLGTALIAFGKPVARILVERSHPLPDAPLRIADAFQDGLHFGVQPLQLALAQRVHFVRRHVGGGRRLERPPIEFLAVRTRPHSRVGARRRALDLQLGDLPLERRRHLLRGNRSRAFGPLARDAGRPPRDRVDERATLARALRGHLHLGQGLVDQKRRRHQAGAAGRLHPGQLPVQLHRVRLQPRQIRLRVRGVLDRMVAVEESRDVEIRADVLDHDVGRVAPSADRDVAIWKPEALGRDPVCAPNHFDAGARRVRERRGVDRPDELPGRRAPGWQSAAVPEATDRSAASGAPSVRRYRCRARSRFQAPGEAGSRQSDRASASARASWSAPDPAGDAPPLQAYASGTPAAEASTAIASRRFITAGYNEKLQSVGEARRYTAVPCAASSGSSTPTAATPQLSRTWRSCVRSSIG